MVADILERYVPSLNGVAVLAVRAKLATMDVGMAIGAVLAHVFEDQLGMALGAGDFLMHSTQRIASLIMIELRV